MIIWLKKYLLSILFTLIFLPVSHSKMVVFDHVTTIQKPINIKVLTKVGFFAAGGRIVDIYLDNNPLKKILTGGDGYGYLKYTPQEAGIKKITAHSVEGSASGLILVMTENERAILIEIEGAFKDSVFSDAIRESSQKAVNSLSENYKIIYLSRFLGKGITGSWLEKQEFPKSVILRWRGLITLKNMKKKGVQLHAIIGSADIISSVSEQIEKRFSFEKTEDGKTVKDWDEILRLLVKSPFFHPNESDSFDKDE
jgi:hypothetical protein